jgi:hypothetical protein
MCWLWNMSCEHAVPQARQRLAQVGLEAVISFDLRSALTGMADCPCPRHGANDCDCQMVVLLVYSGGEPPATLVAHGYGGYTWISLEQGLGMPYPSYSLEVAARIGDALGAPPAA